MTHLRSYRLPNGLGVVATIRDAALATSAASGYFDPVTIGSREFVDGALGANNPVEQVEGEASNIWCFETRDLKPHVKCFISIGAGYPSARAVEDSVAIFLKSTLAGIATEAEDTAQRFAACWRPDGEDRRSYFRFNAHRGFRTWG